MRGRAMRLVLRRREIGLSYPIAPEHDEAGFAAPAPSHHEYSNMRAGTRRKIPATSVTLV